MFQSLELKPDGVDFGGNQKEDVSEDQAPEKVEPEDDSTEAVAFNPLPRRGTRVRAPHSEDLILAKQGCSSQNF